MRFNGKVEPYPENGQQKVTIDFAWLPTQMNCGTLVWLEKYEATWCYHKYVIPCSSWVITHKSLIK